MSIRRAYNLVRQEVDTTLRLTFEEFAILCRLDVAGLPLKTSEIADYQGALRPTMTHRTNHLASLGFIDRGEGAVDRRNIVCTISDDGRAYVRRLSSLTCSQIPAGQPLARTSSERVRKYVDAMGAVYCTAGDLVLLSLFGSEDPFSTVTQLVERLGLLQPTVSMSIGTLNERGLIERTRREGGSNRSTSVSLTDEGTKTAQALATRIAEIVVRRKPRAAQPKE